LSYPITYVAFGPLSVHTSMYRQLGLMDSITHSEIYLFHDTLLVTISVIFLSVVIYYLIVTNTGFQVLNIENISKLDTASEIIWTIVPLFVLCSLRIPSLALLYKLEYIRTVDLTYKVVGHQWYWSYGHRESAIDSYIVAEPTIGDLRLLDVDNRLSVPYGADIRFIVTSTDVIHAFSLPNFFVKCDAVPRRLNTSYINSDVPRLAYRQCSEICRVNHSFIPICLEFVNWEGFIESVARW
jgi:cytochrome c oxidase subunit 2